jgi:hypothetical protein
MEIDRIISPKNNSVLKKGLTNFRKRYQWKCSIFSSRGKYRKLLSLVNGYIA